MSSTQRLLMKVGKDTFGGEVMGFKGEGRGGGKGKGEFFGRYYECGQ